MFWRLEELADHSRGLFDSGDRHFVTYGEILRRVISFQRLLGSGRKKLVALFCDNSVASIVAYLAAIREGHATMLLNASSDPKLKLRLCELYSPEMIVSVGGSLCPADGYDTTIEDRVAVSRAKNPHGGHISPETALLLSTSGTTGSPKLIRLSHQNLQSNASSIAQYLGITHSETAITSLPLSYSYGLSVLNSHLLAGSNVVCTNASLMAKEFWSDFREQKCTSFAGVPFSYSMLERLRFERMDLPSLRTMTQAGGRLDADNVRYFAQIAKRKGIRFFVMYGQTEATARISYVPWERLEEKTSSIGIPIPGGNLRLVKDGVEVTAPGQTGELVFTGPNVMLGYAESRACLSKGDELGGTLSTGDLGSQDEDGYFYISGRLKRFIKIHGLRLSLDEVEKMLESALGCTTACAGNDDHLLVVVESDIQADATEALNQIVSLYKLHHSSVRVRLVTELPVTASGKKDYQRISIESDQP